jgi:hypothetical protein
VCGGEGWQASSGDFQVDDGGLEVAGFDEGGADFVVRPGGVGLEFNRFVQMLGRFGILCFTRQGCTERVLRQIEVGIGGDDRLERGDGAIRF